MKELNLQIVELSNFFKIILGFLSRNEENGSFPTDLLKYA
jgi:hypothetical protein